MRMVPFTKCANHRTFTLCAVLLVVAGGTLSIGLAENQTPPNPLTPQQVSISINQSLPLSFTVPIKRAAIADDKVATVNVISPKLVTITGKAFGFTQVILWDEMGGQTLYDVRVDMDMTRLAATIKQAAPRANIAVSTILDSVILTGTVPDAPTADRIVALAKIFAGKVQNQLIVAGSQQVLLRATIAEVSKEAIRALGINGTFFGSQAFGGSNQSMLNPTSIGLQANRLVPIDVPNQFQITGPDMQVQTTTPYYFGLPHAQLELFLQAMQENRLVRILAEPNLVAISGQHAEFLAGGQIPIPTPNLNGIAITFQEYGIRLKFQPVVQAGEMIRLNVTSEVSEPDYATAVVISGMTIPGLKTRRAQTVVEVGSGQTFAIAGLLSEHVRGVVNKFPGLGELPIIGALLRSHRYERSETELVILVTPDLAAPLNPDEAVYIPGQDFNSPNDWQLFGLGMLDQPKASTTSQPAQPEFLPPGPLHGPWGPQQNAGSGK
jgi:pilus assembly protein CpaC